MAAQTGIRRKVEGHTLGILGELLLFITGGLFLAHAGVLASRVSGYIDGRFPRHPQVTRRGRPRHTIPQEKEKKKEKSRHERSPPAGCIIHSGT